MNALDELIAAADATAVLADGSRPTSPSVPVVWVERDGVLVASVVFGPYPHRVEADSVLMTLSGKPLPVTLSGRMTVPAGVSFTYDLSVRSSLRAD